MKRVKNLVAIFIFVGLLINSTVSIASGAASSSEEPSYLFIQSAKEVQINKSTDKNYEIILKNPDPWIIYFSERPHRDMGFMTLESFLTVLKKEGDKFEPKGLNAAIVSLDRKTTGNITKYVFTLHKPEYKNGDTIILQGSLVPDADNHSTPLKPPETITLSHAVLFIDACIGCTPIP